MITKTLTTADSVGGHGTCLGILFASGSIRGRGTTVSRVFDLNGTESRLALKMFWKNLEWIVDKDAAMRRLAEHDTHSNVIVPLKILNVGRKGQTCTTLGRIRGFLDEEINQLHVENRVLSVSISELKRPVKYFWGLHDFVRGLRGALLGHEFLTGIGMLHCDINENNIVLGVYPWEERGYLIDFDIAILQEAEEQTRVSPTESIGQVHRPAEMGPTQPAGPDKRKHVEWMRTGTFPYISFNVLLGERHTHCDDVESFFYVLLLFFFSYAGPLPKMQLYEAHKKGFVQLTGSGHLSHMRNWPKKYADWADGDPQAIGRLKAFDIWDPFGETTLVASPELKDCLTNNWPQAFHSPIKSLLVDSFKVFSQSTQHTASNRRRTEVSHAQFINILDQWLVTNSVLDHEYSNCPDFKDSRYIV